MWLSALAGTAANIWGMEQAKNAQQKSDAYNQQRMNNLSSWFNKEYYQNYLDSAGAKAQIARLNQQMKDSSKTLQNSAVAGGATPEAVIASQGEMNKGYNDAINNLVSIGDQRKDNVMFRYQGLMQPLEANQMNILQGKVNNWGQFAQNIGGATKGLMEAFGTGGNGGFGDTANIGDVAKYR